jgi:hypothetical protein
MEEVDHATASLAHDQHAVCVVDDRDATVAPREIDDPVDIRAPIKIGDLCRQSKH